MRRSRPCRACPGERLQAPLGPANSMHCPVNSHDRLRSPTFARIGIYDPSYTACVRSTLWHVHGLYPHLDVRTTSAHAVRVPPRAVQRLPLGVRPGAAGGLACAGVQVQVATTPCRGHSTCHDARMHQPSLYSYIPFARFRPTCACACTLHAHRALELQSTRRGRFRQQDVLLPDPCAALTSRAATS